MKAGIRNRELRPLIAAAIEQGWDVAQTKRGHVRFRPPGGGRPVFASKTPSEYRSAMNTRAELRRAGLEV